MFPYNQKTQYQEQFSLICTNTAFPVVEPRPFYMNFSTKGPSTLNISVLRSSLPYNFTQVRLRAYGTTVNGLTIPRYKQTLSLNNGIYTISYNFFTFLEPVSTIQFGNILLEGLKEGNNWVTFGAFYGRKYVTDFNKIPISPFYFLNGCSFNFNNHATKISWIPVPGATSYKVIIGFKSSLDIGAKYLNNNFADIHSLYESIMVDSDIIETSPIQTNSYLLEYPAPDINFLNNYDDIRKNRAIWVYSYTGTLRGHTPLTCLLLSAFGDSFNYNFIFDIVENTVATKSGTNYTIRNLYTKKNTTVSASVADIEHGVLDYTNTYPSDTGTSYTVVIDTILMSKDNLVSLKFSGVSWVTGTRTMNINYKGLYSDYRITFTNRITYFMIIGVFASIPTNLSYSDFSGLPNITIVTNTDVIKVGYITVATGYYTFETSYPGYYIGVTKKNGKYIFTNIAYVAPKLYLTRLDNSNYSLIPSFIADPKTFNSSIFINDTTPHDATVFISEFVTLPNQITLANCAANEIIDTNGYSGDEILNVPGPDINKYKIGVTSYNNKIIFSNIIKPGVSSLYKREAAKMRHKKL